MEFLVPLVTSVTAAIAILCAVWIFRTSQDFNSIHAITSLGVIVYTVYHFYAASTGVGEPIHNVVTGLFVSGVAWVNAYCSHCNTVDSTVNIGICRRKTSIINKQTRLNDRRKVNSHKLFKDLAKHQG